MISLPIDAAVPEIIDRLRAARALVLVAEPGAGKTTRIPPAVLRADGLLSALHPNLVLLQPRRVAARAAAQRIADENGWELGREVGYHIRFERRLSRATRLRVLTEGLLTRQLLDDPFLEGIGCVILDEFHERGMHSDLAIALLREVRETVREDLVLIVMSATLDADPIARFLGDCPVVRVPGRMFPVELTYTTTSSGESLSARMASAIAGEVERPDSAGDVLAFLPGAEEIRRTARALDGLAGREGLDVLPLHGSLPFDEQVRALRPALAGRRKVVLATNIAETSLTIDGVRTVIDSGLARVAAYDLARGLDRLDLCRISKASTAQRAGRAGRTASGRCMRLWSEKRQHELDEFELPEIHRIDLAGVVLSLHAWGRSDVREFGWFESPAEESLAAAERLLAMLGALDGEERGTITPLGRRMAELPLHPRLARLMLAAIDANRPELGAAIAALLFEKDLLIPNLSARQLGPSINTRSDLIVRLAHLADAERERFSPSLFDRGIDPVAARQIARTRDHLLRNDRSSMAQGNDDALVLQLLLLAYPDRVCRRRESDPAAGAMVGGGGVRLAAESGVRRGELFLAIDARQDPRNARAEALVRIASHIEQNWLEELFPGALKRVRETVYDEERQRVIGRVTTLYRDLPLHVSTDAAVDRNEAGPALAAALRPRAESIFLADEVAASVLARIAFLEAAMPELDWPRFDAERLGELLSEASAGAASLEELRRNGLVGAIMAALSHALWRTLETEAPETIVVPSGSRMRVQYTRGQPPLLAVRLQELFGWHDGPRLAGGRVPIRLHLLGPNFRPVQITSDLRSFWATTYFQVRKDLRTRYPKHKWPEDPLSAKPEAKGGRGR